MAARIEVKMLSAKLAVAVMIIWALANSAHGVAPFQKISDVATFIAREADALDGRRKFLRTLGGEVASLGISKAKEVAASLRIAEVAERIDAALRPGGVISAKLNSIQPHEVPDFPMSALVHCEDQEDAWVEMEEYLERKDGDLEALGALIQTLRRLKRLNDELLEFAGEYAAFLDELDQVLAIDMTANMTSVSPFVDAWREYNTPLDPESVPGKLNKNERTIERLLDNALGRLEGYDDSPKANTFDDVRSSCIEPSDQAAGQATEKRPPESIQQRDESVESGDSRWSSSRCEQEYASRIQPRIRGVHDLQGCSLRQELESLAQTMRKFSDSCGMHVAFAHTAEQAKMMVSAARESGC